MTARRWIARGLRYALLPEILPRLREFGFNMSLIAYLMARVMQQTRLLPAHHTYLLARNYGTFGVRDVLAAAGTNLRLDWRHSDQVVVFGMIVLAIVLMIGQVMAIAALLLVGAAHAAGPGWGSPLPFGSMFRTANPEKDIAYKMMDKVFGVPNLFNSENDPGSLAAITPFTRGLQAMFEFYSYGMLIIGGFILMYYIFVVIAETAQTGSPFGQRFASVYAPLRLVIAILILLPAAYGYNIGQHFTLIVATWGSSLATNSWLVFNRALSNPLGYNAQDLTAIPKIADIGMLLKFYSLAHACKASYDYLEGKQIDPYLITRSGPNTSLLLSGQSFDQALEFTKGKDIIIRFGEKDAKHAKARGMVEPYCGEIVLEVDARDVDYSLPLYRTYFDLAKNLWTSSELAGFGSRYALALIPHASGRPDPCSIVVGSYAWPEDQCAYAPPNPGYIVDMKQNYQAVFDSYLNNAVEQVRADSINRLQNNQDLLTLGWGGAGIWFNKIAEHNGALVKAAYNMPTVAAYPSVMEVVRKENSRGDSSTTTSCYAPTSSGGVPVQFKENQDNDGNIASVLTSVCVYFQQSRAVDESKEGPTGNMLIDYVNETFSGDALLSLRKNQGVHPLAQMTAMGSSIIEKTLNYLAKGMATSALGGIASQDTYSADPEISKHVGQAYGEAGRAFSSVFMMLAFTGLTSGFILYYVIPFMPFIYFFFACGRWVKTVFEAMVGIPLWALAHLRIDGEGIPAQAAANGYYLILEIMLRPLLTLLGMVAAISIFTVMATMLNFMFDLVIDNLAGHDMNQASANPGALEKMVNNMRGSLDQFFYTVLYAILLYMMALACFKMIDNVPKGILQWIGAGVASFGDKAPDPTENLVTYAGYGGSSMTEGLKGGIQDASFGTGQYLGKNLDNKSLDDLKDRLKNIVTGKENLSE